MTRPRGRPGGRGPVLARPPPNAPGTKKGQDQNQQGGSAEAGFMKGCRSRCGPHPRRPVVGAPGPGAEQNLQGPQYFACRTSAPNAKALKRSSHADAVQRDANGGVHRDERPAGRHPETIRGSSSGGVRVGVAAGGTRPERAADKLARRHIEQQYVATGRFSGCAIVPTSLVRAASAQARCMSISA